MTTKFKTLVLTLFGAVAAISTPAQTSILSESNLLQSVTVALNVYSEGTPMVTGSGTNHIINGGTLRTKDLIRLVSASGTFKPGDILVRARSVSNTVTTVTNLFPISTTNLIITNLTTNGGPVSNAVVFGGVSNYIGASNLVFGTNIETIGDSNVTFGTNVLAVVEGSSTNALSFTIGTNTTVVATSLTNSSGATTGTNYLFTINALNISATNTNSLGSASWNIYNPNSTPILAPISTNVVFNLYTDDIYTGTNSDSTNLARVIGDDVGRSGIIETGAVDAIRSLVLSNSAMQFKITGFARGHIVRVSLGGSHIVYSRDFNETAAGSGTTNTTSILLDGGITETYFKLLKPQP
jgi:hypothetical protein